MLEHKTAQCDTARERVSSLESQIKKNDHLLTEQKKLLKLAEEEYQEKIKALDEKYSAQKAFVLCLAAIIELYKYIPGVNTSMQDSERTGSYTIIVTFNFFTDTILIMILFLDMVGSLDHTSPNNADQYQAINVSQIYINIRIWIYFKLFNFSSIFKLI